MDRAAIIEDLKLWLLMCVEFADFPEPEEILEKIAELEEEYE